MSVSANTLPHKMPLCSKFHYGDYCTRCEPAATQVWSCNDILPTEDPSPASSAVVHMVAVAKHAKQEQGQKQ